MKSSKEAAISRALSTSIGLNAPLIDFKAFLRSQGALIKCVVSSALFKTQIAVNSHDMHSQAVQFSLTPEFEVKFDNGIRLTAIGRLLSQAVDGLEPVDNDLEAYSPASRPGLLSPNTEFELREFFFEMAIGEDYLTLGKQQVVWGKADGLKVLDVVNPQSFREFILADFEDSRIPLWTVNYEWKLGDNSNLQVLWIPDQSMHALPERNATYAFTSSRLVPSAPLGVNVKLGAVDRPSRVISDSDFGFDFGC